MRTLSPAVYLRVMYGALRAGVESWQDCMGESPFVSHIVESAEIIILLFYFPFFFFFLPSLNFLQGKCVYLKMCLEELFNINKKSASKQGTPKIHSNNFFPQFYQCSGR